VASLEEIQSLRIRSEQASMGSYESLIWNQFGQRFVEKTDRLKVITLSIQKLHITYLMLSA